MKLVFLLLFAALGARAETCQTPEYALKKSKLVFDLLQSGQLDPTASCVPDGFRCHSSTECCGTLFCRNGACDSGSIACRGNGAACTSSTQCCGTMFCREGACDDGSISCRGEHAACTSSTQCCGTMFCRGGACE
jgi:hypothetical protein